MQPISDAQARKAIEYSHACWGEEVRAMMFPPFTEHHAYGILCQETAYFWLQFIGRLTPAEISARCVLDGSGDVAGTSRNAFPRNTAAFRVKYGDEFTEILIKEGNKTRALRGMRPWGKIYKGYGPFQFDLQYVLSDEAFFRDLRWYDFAECLKRVVLELKFKYANHHNVHDAIKAYNGSGPRAEEYADNVIHYAELSEEIL